MKILEFSLSSDPNSDIVEMWLKVSQKDWPDTLVGKEMDIIPDRISYTFNGYHYSLTNIKFKKYYPAYFNTEINMVYQADCKKTEMIYPDGHNPFVEVRPKFNI